MASQADLFAAAFTYPAGLVYRDAFVDRDEEARLLAEVDKLPIAEARYRQYTARRRIASFGYGYDFTSNRLQPAPPIPAFLLPLRDRVAKLAGIPAESFVQGLVTEYRPGTPIGWHRDVPQFGIVAGISLLSACRMRFRPYPPSRNDARKGFTLALAPRSVYVLADSIRRDWQHCIPEVPAQRWSITFRTLRVPA
jgi:alkylated DNA repair dioxygenase AlkB